MIVELKSNDEFRKDIATYNKTKEEYVALVLPVFLEDAEKQLKKLLETEYDKWNKEKN